jgi:hypothetical protein
VPKERKKERKKEIKKERKKEEWFGLLKAIYQDEL